MRISDYLRQLGDTPEEVAVSLASQGIKGVRKQAYCCAIIVGIKKNCSDSMWPGIKAPRPGMITYSDAQIMDPICPQPVTEFMREFDDGKHPYLEHQH